MIPSQPPCRECGAAIPLEDRPGKRREFCTPCISGRRPVARSCESCGAQFETAWRSSNTRRLCEGCRAPNAGRAGRNCAWCDSWFTTRASKDAKCCSRSCASRLRAGAASSPLYVADCGGCGAAFASRRRLDYCSAACRPVVIPRPKLVRPVPQTAIAYEPCAECGGLFVHRVSRPKKFCSTTCCDRAARRSRRHKERAEGLRNKGRVRRGAQVESFTLREIAVRDGWRCHICAKRVPDRPYKARPLDATLDHLVPVADGGDHTRANVALAHNRCNYERGQFGEVQLRLVG